MAKRITKAEATLIVFAVIIGVPIYLAFKVVETTGWVVPVVGGIVVVILIFWYQYSKKQKRLAYLREKYKDEELVQNIYGGYFWQGQTEEQLIDAIGEPLAVDRKVLKIKNRDIWKYNRKGANRYGLRITIEDGCVVGWDKKE